MKSVVISGTGLQHPNNIATNEEVVASFNAYVQRFNEAHQVEIESGKMEPLKPSSAEFIEKASGIKQRYYYDKKNILDINVMDAKYPKRTDDEPSFQCEIGVEAAKVALKNANKQPEDIDCVIAAFSGSSRAYPAMAIEIQAQLGIKGYAYDMNVACSSATFAIANAFNAIQGGSAQCVLIVNPELIGGNLNFKDRDSHFIFGDATTALIIETRDTATSDHTYEILGTDLLTQFSSNIRNNFGLLTERTTEALQAPDTYFYQQGRKVFKDIVPLVPEFIGAHLSKLGLETKDLRRLWLHQANANMNELIAKKILGHPTSQDEAPLTLSEFGNTGSCGSIIAMHKNHKDLVSGDIMALCSFGAGYSIGSVILRKI